MKAIRKLKSSRGFSLAETLLAVMIMLIVAGLVAEGVTPIMGVYEKATLGANAQVVLSTTVTALRGQLTTAKDVEKGQDENGYTTIISYTDAATGVTSRIYLYGTIGETVAPEGSAPPQNTIMLQRYSNYIDDGDLNPSLAPAPQPLVSFGKDKDLYIEYESVDYTDGVVTFTGLKVHPISPIENVQSKVYASLDELVIRVLSDS